MSEWTAARRNLFDVAVENRFVCNQGRTTSNALAGIAYATLSFFAALAAVPATAATETVLSNFASPNVTNPTDRLTFYSNNCVRPCLIGAGDGDVGAAGVFELTYSLVTHTWVETSPLAFTGTVGRVGAPIATSSGTIFGTNPFGGSVGKGDAYQVYYSGGNWVTKVIWSFGGAGDGAYPYSGLAQGANSDTLYGMTYAGGAKGRGTVFSLTWNGSAWKETILYNFGLGNDGSGPIGTLFRDNSGNLYGATLYGGSYGGTYGGYGTVFELTPSGTGWSEKILHSFGNGPDGTAPEDGIIEAPGQLGSAFYGTTSGGGLYGKGAVFVLQAFHGVWGEGLIHSFSGGNDGAAPWTTLCWSSQNNTLYGTTQEGGSANFGTVFALTRSGTSWSESVLHSFGSGADGIYPLGSMIMDSSGNLYGTTWRGGSNDFGIVFEISP